MEELQFLSWFPLFQAGHGLQHILPERTQLSLDSTSLLRRQVSRHLGNGCLHSPVGIPRFLLAIFRLCGQPQNHTWGLAWPAESGSHRSDDGRRHLRSGCTSLSSSFLWLDSVSSHGRLWAIANMVVCISASSRCLLS